MCAGALGFSTSRTILHRAKDGVPVPGTWAGADELEAIAGAMGRAGHGVFELASDMAPAADEFAWMRRIARDTGVPLTFGMLQSPLQPNAWREMLKLANAANDEGANLYAQIAIRPTGLVLGWESTVNPFTFQPSYQAIAHLPVKERLERLRDPETRARIIAERPPIEGELAVLRMILAQGFDRMFRLMTPQGPDYEPAPDASVAAEAKRTGKDPRAIVYDMLMENNGRGYVYLPLLNYAEFNFDHIHEMLQSDRTVLSLSDGGAHCGVICDASFPTYLLTHWVRDRSRGKRITLEQAVKRQCHDTARLYGLHDRGTLTPGQRADINVIDLERLAIDAPQIVYDLPAGGRRLIQRARGYSHTFVAGVETFRDGKSTGAKPGRLVRGVQAKPMAVAAE
jgi:N-acyl-D-aspartate/D-glutamate deacylase